MNAFEKAVALDASNYLYWGNLGDGYRWAPGQKNKAGEAYRRAAALLAERIVRQPDDSESVSRLALYRGKLGDAAAAAVELSKLEAMKSVSPTARFKSALALELLGQRSRALQALTAAIRGGYSIQKINREPEIAGLRTDPGFQRLIAALKP